MPSLSVMTQRNGPYGFLWSLVGKLFTVAMAAYLFSLAQDHVMQEAIRYLTALLAAAVGRF